MRTALCLLLAVVATTLSGAQPDPTEGAVLWSRITMSMGTGSNEVRTFDGWYDPVTRVLVSKEDAEGETPFAPSPLNAARIVKVETAPRQPARPAKVVDIVTKARAEKAKNPQ